ncbi:unnamed protein product [Leptidea sinapis]|uniref:Set2 Rpb1 interacting domain-containing protein n=1 Tax=Leptidea sinapis TaxID=189913 RepID=A0A5E4R1Q0_9NEOP|nr:unnamed protein product [Leptidea sinapis]
MSATLQRAGFVSHDDSSDLYGQGRDGQKREIESYYGDGGDESDGENERRRVAQETRSLIMKEFANRKRSIESERLKDNDSQSAKYSKCKAADSTGTKVNGLTVACRESYLSLLTDALNNNMTNMKGIEEPTRALSRRDIEQCAVELEYEAFSNSTVISLYRRALTKLISAIKGCSESLYPALKNYEPKKHETLGEFVKDFEKKRREESQKDRSFVTAAQLESGKIEIKNEARELSKADKETKRKANSFKKDPLTQTKLKTFFTPVSSQEASDAFSNYSDESGDECGLVIDEHVKPDPMESTLKLEELNDSQDNDYDETLKLEESSSNDAALKKHTKTFVINITLQGIPSTNKTKENMNDDSIKLHDKNMALPKTPAKRKIKDLFGESSDESDFETHKDKRVKSCKEKSLEMHKQDRKLPEEIQSSQSQKNEKHKDKKILRDEKTHKSENIHKDTKSCKDGRPHNEEDKSHKDDKYKKYDAVHKDERSHKENKYNKGDGIQKDERSHKDRAKKGDKYPKGERSHKADRSHNSDRSSKDEKSNKDNRSPKKVTSHKDDRSYKDYRLHKKEKAESEENINLQISNKNEKVKNERKRSLSGSDSERELMIDENNAVESSGDLDETFSVSNTTNVKIHDDSNSLIKNSKDGKILDYDDNACHNILKKSRDPLCKTSINKDKLSEEADKVLKELQQFSEIKSCPEPDRPNNQTDVNNLESIKNTSNSNPISPKVSSVKQSPKKDLSPKMLKDKLAKEHLKEKAVREHKHSSKAKHHKHGKVIKKDKREKVDVAGLVVKLLMPYYKKKRISNRDLFKTTARHIVHQLLALQVTEEAAINILLKNSFSKNITIESEDDLDTKLQLSNDV